MEKKNVKEVAPISEEEFQDLFRNTLKLQYFECVRRFKPVKRAFKKGYITNFGYILPNLPKGPFNNKKHTKGRETNIEKKIIWEKIPGKRVIW